MFCHVWRVKASTSSSRSFACLPLSSFHFMYLYDFWRRYCFIMVVPSCTGYDAQSQYLNGGKPIWPTTKTCFCNKLSCMSIFRIHKQVYAGCLEQCHILWHSNLKFNKRIDFPVYVNVNWRKTSFMKQNWVITLN